MGVIQDWLSCRPRSRIGEGMDEDEKAPAGTRMDDECDFDAPVDGSSQTGIRSESCGA